MYYARNRHRDERVKRFIQLIPNGSRVALLADKESWIYHFYLFKPEVIIEPIKSEKLSDQISSYDYLLCLDIDCSKMNDQSSYQILWSSAPENKELGTLWKILPHGQKTKT